MRFARIAYGVAAAYGFLTLTPLYFMVGNIGHDAPPPVTHPEFYYGFVGVALLWQMIFVLIARDPNSLPIHYADHDSGKARLYGSRCSLVSPRTGPPTNPSACAD
jgi:hypothetical protein